MLNKLPAHMPNNSRVFLTGLLTIAILILPIAQTSVLSRGGSNPGLATDENSPGVREARGVNPQPVPPLKPLAPAVNPVTANLTDNIANTTKVDKGSTITYTATIQNVTGGAITGVEFQDTPDANTTLNVASIASSAVANNDTYPQTVIGNVSINSANIPYSVVTNDYLGSNPAATITAFDATSLQGGTVSMTQSGAGIGQFT